MTHLAFYAPLKPPDHPVPSGDRAMARALITALQADGATVDVASRFQSRDGVGDAQVQAQKFRDAKVETERLTKLGRSAQWSAWLTYHNYYKAPDLLGPAVSQALGIPYILVEATRARKRLAGPWSRFAQASEAACDKADLIFFLTRRDGEALQAYRKGRQRVVRLRPFIPQKSLPMLSGQRDRMLSVGMMRFGDKLASYRLIAQSLALLKQTDWQLDVVGDGPARSDVEDLLSLFGARVRFLGELAADALNQAYRQASIFVWPGVNEAFGMAYLEAQAAGLTVVAQRRLGVEDVLYPGAAYPAVEDGPFALAARLDLLLSQPKLTYHLGLHARHYVAENHLLNSASEVLHSELEKVLSWSD